ncbi:aminotransferase [Thermosipho affectus]|uniref:histidinol-phosphate transaminase n=1 Tax=Thermosipho affectus TaxID=660294 RepID=A0ABX3IH49_9BACT|nr:aminotransferase class I/II-fold pyridoxal phosphate-dependent enzyme [Thermosipho affectus]ONN27156.1 aminotransferase [Thermosipho affectus]
MDNFNNGHGGIKEKDILDFSISVNPLRLSWIEKLPFENLFRYTYIQWIEEKFYKHFNGVVVAGATEAFHIVGYHILNDAYVIIPRPNYLDYFKVAKFSSKYIDSPWYFVKKKFDLNILEESIKCGKRKNKKVAVFLGNPNNPTGIYQDLHELIKLNEDVIFIIDEAFIDFVGKCVDIDYENVVRIRTFTKFFGIPGIRVGYVISKKFENIFKRYRMEWGVGGMGYTFLEKLLDNLKGLKDFTLKTHEFIVAQKKLFEDFIYVKSDANYFLIDVKNVGKFLNFSLENKVYVRDARNFGLNLVRVGIKNKEDNKVLLNTLKKWRDICDSRLYRKW